jgi:hypothetical protein
MKLECRQCQYDEKEDLKNSVQIPGPSGLNLMLMRIVLASAVANPASLKPGGFDQQRSNVFRAGRGCGCGNSCNGDTSAGGEAHQWATLRDAIQADFMGLQENKGLALAPVYLRGRGFGGLAPDSWSERMIPDLFGAHPS